MSSFCRETDEGGKALRKAEHIEKCKTNYSGSAPSMETEGVKRIFERSEATHKLQYTEYLAMVIGKRSMKFKTFMGIMLKL
jgi:hypothetical protein